MVDPIYSEYEKDKTKKIPLILNPDSFEIFARSDIEVLHYILNAIREEHYPTEKHYSYKDEGKAVRCERFRTGM